jgi:hypothetical protein
MRKTTGEASAPLLSAYLIENHPAPRFPITRPEHENAKFGSRSIDYFIVLKLFWG